MNTSFKQPNISNKTIVLALGILVLISIGVLVWSFNFKNKTTNTTQSNVISKTQKETLKQTDITDMLSEVLNTEDWLTYRNEEYGFEFRYPREWELEETNQPSTNIIGSENKTMSILYLDDPDKNYFIPLGIYIVDLGIEQLPQQIFSQNMIPNGTILKQSIRDGEQSIITQHTADIGLDYINWIFQYKNNTSLVFNTSKNFPTYGSVHKIMQTLRFF